MNSGYGYPQDYSPPKKMKKKEQKTHKTRNTMKLKSKDEIITYLIESIEDQAKAYYTEKDILKGQIDALKWVLSLNPKASVTLPMEEEDLPFKPEPIPNT